MCAGSLRRGDGGHGRRGPVQAGPVRRGAGRRGAARAGSRRVQRPLLWTVLHEIHTDLLLLCISFYIRPAGTSSNAYTYIYCFM